MILNIINIILLKLSSPKPFAIMFNLYNNTYYIAHILGYIFQFMYLVLWYFLHLIFSTSCILYIWHHSWHMVGSVLTYSGLSALHKKLSQKLVNLASTNAGCQVVHKKVEVIWKWSKTFVFNSPLLLLTWSGIIGPED